MFWIFHYLYVYTLYSPLLRAISRLNYERIYEPSGQIVFLHVVSRLGELYVVYEIVKSLVCPHLEYFCEIWSPSIKELKHMLEMVQRHAVRFVTNDYRQTSSANAMLKELNWGTLESRTLFQLKYVHKMFSSQVVLNPLDYFERNTYSSIRYSH